MKKRVLSLFMALVLCLTLLPTAALADWDADITWIDAVSADGSLITNYDSFVSPISVNTRKVLCRKASGVFVFRGISPIWAGFG